MVSFSLGSIQAEISKLIPDIPTAISGTDMNSIINQQLLYINEFTGDSIGSNAITDKYQPALIDLAAAAVLANMELQGADAQSYTLGDFSISKGGESNLAKARNYFKESGMDKLRALGRAARYVKANG